jgi:hypothetical protein
MKYTEDGDRIILEMSQDDYQQLLMMVGYGLGSVRRNGNEDLYWDWLKFINEMNAGNPGFKPYKIPATTRVNP